MYGKILLTDNVKWYVNQIIKAYSYLTKKDRISEINGYQKEITEYPLCTDVLTAMAVKVTDEDKEKMLSYIGKYFVRLVEIEQFLDKIIELIDQINCSCKL